MNVNAILHSECDNEDCDVLNESTMSEAMEQDILQVENMNGNKKRSRELDQDDEWTEVVRNKKRISQASVDVYITSKELLPKQFALAKLFKTHNIINITSVKYLNPYKISVEFSNEDSAENFLRSDFVSNSDWRCQKSLEVGISYGLIRNVELDLTEKDIMSILESSIPVVNVMRLKRRNKGDSKESGWVESEVVRLGFKGPSLPEYVYIYSMRIKVEPYIFPVSQCARCWKFGHTTSRCTYKKMVCPKCGLNHANCEVTSFTCPNCSGNHMALSKDCPVFLKERRLRVIMSESNCSFRKALTVYVPPASQTNTEPIATSSNNITDTPTPVLPVKVVIPDSRSYSHITAQPKSPLLPMPKTNVKKDKKQLKRAPTAQDSMDNLTSDSDQEQEQQNKSIESNIRNSKKNTQKEDHSFRRFIQKFTTVLSDKNTWKEKVKVLINMVIDWVISWVVSNVADVSFLANIFNG